MLEQQANIPISHSDHFPILREEAMVIEQPDAGDPKTVAAVARLFDADFVEDDVSIAMKRAGDQIVKRISAVPYTESRALLIEFGIQVVPFLEQLYPEVVREDPNELSGRLAHTLVYTQNRLQVDQTSRGRLMTLGQRNNMLFEFSERLTNA